VMKSACLRVFPGVGIALQPESAALEEKDAALPWDTKSQIVLTVKPEFMFVRSQPMEQMKDIMTNKWRDSNFRSTDMTWKRQFIEHAYTAGDGTLLEQESAHQKWIESHCSNPPDPMQDVSLCFDKAPRDGKTLVEIVKMMRQWQESVAERYDALHQAEGHRQFTHGLTLGTMTPQHHGGDQAADLCKPLPYLAQGAWAAARKGAAKEDWTEMQVVKDACGVVEVVGFRNKGAKTFTADQQTGLRPNKQASEEELLEMHKDEDPNLKRSLFEDTDDYVKRTTKWVKRMMHDNTPIIHMPTFPKTKAGTMAKFMKGRKRNIDLDKKEEDDNEGRHDDEQLHGGLQAVDVAPKYRLKNLGDNPDLITDTTLDDYGKKVEIKAHEIKAADLELDEAAVRAAAHLRDDLQDLQEALK